MQINVEVLDGPDGLIIVGAPDGWLDLLKCDHPYKVIKMLSDTTARIEVLERPSARR